MFFQGHGAIRKDFFHIAADKQPVHDCSAGHGVGHVVPAACAAILFLEYVDVDPLAIGTAQLLIHEPEGCIPDCDFSAPPDRQAMDAQPVINQDAGAHGDFAGGDDVKIQPRRRNALQLARIGKKREHLFPGRGQPEFGFKDMRRHAGRTMPQKSAKAKRFTLEPAAVKNYAVHHLMKAILALEDGSIFHGTGFGAKASAAGEVCFNTSMTGYQEILTDPSYKGQIVTMTYPLIGNYGVNAVDVESWRTHAAGFVIRELSPVVSNWRADCSLAEYLEKNGIPGIQGIDTRALTKKLRVRGALNGFITTEDISDEEAIKRAKEFVFVGVDYVKEVTHKESFRWDEKDEQSAAFDLVRGNARLDARNHRKPLPAADIPIVAFDYGMKYNILRRLRQQGFATQVLPATATAAEALKYKPAGVFLSNGPGDPAALNYIVREVKTLLDHGIPIFGICLGHQILGQAFGGKTFKLKFGHRGGNQPVKDFETGKVEITSQNHGFAVDAASLPSDVAVNRINLNDQTVEGLRHKTKPVFCVQYHPEASPGPHDSTPLFAEFRELIAKRG